MEGGGVNISVNIMISGKRQRVTFKLSQQVNIRVHDKIQTHPE